MSLRFPNSFIHLSDEMNLAELRVGQHFGGLTRNRYKTRKRFVAGKIYGDYYIDFLSENVTYFMTFKIFCNVGKVL